MFMCIIINWITGLKVDHSNNFIIQATFKILMTMMMMMMMKTSYSM